MIWRRLIFLLDSAEVSAMVDILIFNSMFAGFLFGLIAPKFVKLIQFSCDFLSKKLGKDKRKQDKKSKKEEVEK